LHLQLDTEQINNTQLFMLFFATNISLKSLSVSLDSYAENH